MPRRSNRRPDGAQPCKQHSDRALSLMLLGDFETGFWARSAVTLQLRVASHIWPEIAEFGTAKNVSPKLPLD
ncbi:hypothetical protein [Lacticaseibacillus paracasei]|uniref:hypothetical protein n=1 Tax=Lacticaseibacillus paracasei TaxID=1597 RepID=UPI002987FE47|nr:hypothetical protein [Lacticaseibacillus paracasei]WRP02347.1 hypothetical protein U8C12_11150 [Lacticaseibacillus paracasei]